MTDQRIYELACIFKTAMLAARDEGLFERDVIFSRFPRGCCGLTCYLLATFLKDYGIETIYVWGVYGEQSHAWLVVNDNRIKDPEHRYIAVEENLARLIEQYGGEGAGPIGTANYRARDLTNGLVIDITADQFGGPSVYVGKRNAFYQKHTFRDAHICDGVYNYQLRNIYRKASLFLPK